MDQARAENRVLPEKGMRLALPAWAGSAAGPLVWGLLGATACLAVAGLEPNLVEEGLVVHVAQRLVSGEHMYRDITFFSLRIPLVLASQRPEPRASLSKRSRSPSLSRSAQLAP